MSFLPFGQRHMYCWYLYFAVQTHYFSLYLVAWVGAVSNKWDNCLFLTFTGLPHAFSFVYESLMNPLDFFSSNINKFIIRLEEIFHCQICIHFSACYEKIITSGGPSGHYPFTLQNKLGFSPTIMPQGIVIVQRHPVYVMIRNNFRIIELEYLPIHHPYLFLLILRHIQTRKC